MFAIASKADGVLYFTSLDGTSHLQWALWMKTRVKLQLISEILTSHTTNCLQKILCKQEHGYVIYIRDEIKFKYQI